MRVHKKIHYVLKFGIDTWRTEYLFKKSEFLTENQKDSNGD